MSFFSRYARLPDAEIMSLIGESDHTAYRELYQRYFHLILTHAFKKLRDEDLAKDVVQEVFTNLWDKRLSLDIASNVAGYLYTAVRNRIFDLFAREQVKGKYLESLAEYLETHQVTAADHRIREQQLQDYIDRQIQALPPKMRKVFELSRKAHLSHREIADAIGTTEGNVSKQVTNALRILRARLGMLMLILVLVFLRGMIVLITCLGVPLVLVASEVHSKYREQWVS
jgi:RNA polymerase sigma-70 factor (family 1)